MSVIFSTVFTTRKNKVHHTHGPRDLTLTNWCEGEIVPVALKFSQRLDLSLLANSDILDSEVFEVCAAANDSRSGGLEDGSGWGHFAGGLG